MLPKVFAWFWASTVGIQIPNHTREQISLRELLESDAYKRSTSKLTIALGKTIHGEPYMADLATMPHLLIAGSTGAGKSVSMNGMLTSILYRASPDDVRLILIDPKRLELGMYEDIPHLLTPVVVDQKQASNALRWAVREMDVLTPDGELITVTPEGEHADLFRGFPNSYGTLGYALRIVIDVQPVRPYVAIEHRRVDGPAVGGRQQQARIVVRQTAADRNTGERKQHIRNPVHADHVGLHADRQHRHPLQQSFHASAS